jgi:putative transposase
MYPFKDRFFAKKTLTLNMKKSKYSESQAFGILKEQELGKSVIEICRTHGITQGTFYR